MLNLRGLRQLHHQFEITDRSDRFSGKMSKTSEKNKTAGFATQSARRQRCQGKKLKMAVAKQAIGIVALGMSSAIAMQCDSLWNSSASRAVAQVVPDTTLGAESSQVTPGLIQQISGGATRGTNLFHSFQQFSIPKGGEAQFLNAPQIQNIIGRVIGLSPSQIYGSIQTKGAASLYLINPNGIIFGPNATLKIGGSFIGTTANALAFPDGNIFSASTPNIPAQTLTVNPSAFLFNQLTNQSTPRIEVQPGATLTVGDTGNPASLFLVGGNVLVNGGTLQGVAGSRVEVAGFTGSGSVNFTVDGNILDLVFPFNGVAGADVTLTNGAVVNVGTNSEDADGILLVGGTVALTNRSQLSTSTFGTGDAGIVFLQADTILIDTSSLFSTAEAGASGDAGGLLLNANSISIRNAKLDTTNSGSGVAGDMILNGRNSVSIVDSEITSASANNLPSNLPAGTTPDFGFIAIAASEGSVVFDNSSISTTNSGSGIAGDISITARDRVSITNSFSLDDNNRKGIFSQGNQGRIFIGASDTYASFSPQTVAIDNSLLSSDNSTAVGDGDINAGKISIQANDDVFLTNNTQLITSTFRQGSAGDVSIKTNGSSVSLDNSSIFSTVESGGDGNGGRIEIETGSLSLNNGAQLQTIVRGGGIGDPGIIYVEAADSVSLAGISPTNGNPSGIFSVIDQNAQGGFGSSQFAGGIFDAIISDSGADIVGAIGIKTGSLSLTDGAQLNTSTDGRGNAGAVLVLARDEVSLKNGGAILSAAGTNAQGSSGAILLGVGSLSIDGTSGVPTGLTTQTDGNGDAGLIFVAADRDISLKGHGSGIFSTIEQTATGDSGGVLISARDLYIKDGAELSVSNNNPSSGTAGDIYLTTRDLRLEDGGTITATTLSGNGGNISIDARDLLVLTNSSNISTEAGRADAGGNGGNIGIKTQYIFAAPVNDSNIIAQAYTGNGGSISVSAAQLYKIAPRPAVPPTNDIDASSRYGQDGQVTTNVLNVDPTQGLNSLSENPVDPSRLIAQQCAARSRESGQENKFTITGRGGIPTSPNNTLQNESVVTDWVGEPPQKNPSENNHSANPDRSFSTATNSAKPSELVEAQGWVIGEKGEIILTANAPTVIPHDLKLTPAASCHGS